MKELVLGNVNHKISKTQDSVEDPVRLVYQKSEALNQTNDSLQVKLIEQRGILYDTLKPPMPLG